MYSVSIVIPYYKRWDLASSLLYGLRQYEGGNIGEIIIVDDKSMDIEFSRGITSYLNELPIRVIENSENLGFTKTSNLGLMAATGLVAERKFVFLISTDVSIFGKFIDKSVEILDTPQRTLLGGKLLTHNTGWNEFDGRVFPYLEGWFLACKSDGWRELGYFDENYSPYDYEDIDLTTTATRAGYKIQPLNSPNIRHAGGASIGYTTQRKQITERNREYFRKKWIK